MRYRMGETGKHREYDVGAKSLFVDVFDLNIVDYMVVNKPQYSVRMAFIDLLILTSKY